MKCPRCPNKVFHDADGAWCICGWREPFQPFPEDPPARHAHKTINRYEELKRESRK